MISSRNNLSGYYLWYKKDSVKHLQEALKAVNAHSQQIIKNSDKTLEKMKLLYEFDSLKTDINFNKKIVSEQSKTISQKNTSIMLSVGITVLLAVFIIFIFILFRKQKKLSSQKNEMNQALEKSVHNYQLLIRESNHRIKNNLQMILSMLALDMESLEEKDKDLLANISSKISTISALHRILDFKEHNEKVKLSTYFDEILAYYNDISTEKLQFTTDYAKIYIPSERVIYFGLVLNELIANTIKHRKETGEIVIQVLKSDNELIFYYRDNSNFGEFQKNSGFELMEGLIERFGARNLVFNAENGEFKFYFDE
jgi:two-component sensor histidine kinase